MQGEIICNFNAQRIIKRKSASNELENVKIQENQVFTRQKSIPAQSHKRDLYVDNPEFLVYHWSGKAAAFSPATGERATKASELIFDEKFDEAHMHIGTAIVEAWYLGEQGGLAVADVLFGNVNSSGKLPVSVPRSAGHVPTVYDHKPSGRDYYHHRGTPEKPGHDYVFSTPDPLFCFGYGLRYTDFEYAI